jgi:C1A family cysteine protease
MSRRVPSLCLVAALAATVAVAASSAASHHLSSAELVSAFSHFKRRYAVEYTSGAEEARRFDVFAANMRRAAEHQRKNPKATFGVNEFADRTPEEFKTRHNADRVLAETIAEVRSGKRDNQYRVLPRPSAAQLQSLPTHIDWRTKGAVNPIKNQGNCGSCWAFGAIANIESMWFLAGNNLTVLAEQELVSCDKFFAYGCNGSASVLADFWLVNNRAGVVSTQASYPYVSGLDGTVPACNATRGTFGAKIAGAEVLLPFDAAGMELFLATRGPLSVAVAAESWNSYTGGILTSCESWQLPDHQVAIVGYGSDSTGTPYWIIRNSWGVNWGEDGYMRIQRGLNLCEVELLATTATVAPPS